MLCSCPTKFAGLLVLPLLFLLHASLSGFSIGSATNRCQCSIVTPWIDSASFSCVGRIWGLQQPCRQNPWAENAAWGGRSAGRSENPSQASCLCSQCSRHSSVHRYSLIKSIFVKHESAIPDVIYSSSGWGKTLRGDRDAVAHFPSQGHHL